MINIHNFDEMSKAFDSYHKDMPRSEYVGLGGYFSETGYVTFRIMYEDYFESITIYDNGIIDAIDKYTTKDVQRIIG